jgi:pimeloyl-ACP methyl ester carboxylesterase
MHIFWIGLILIFSIINLADFRLNDRSLYEKLQKNNVHGAIRYYQYRKYKIRYIDIGDEDKPLIIFIHGAPGSLDAFFNFLNDSTLNRHFRMISVDRPGYGYSGYGESLISIDQQAHALLPLLNINRNKIKPLLIGHSYGGTIVTKMAMISPGNIGSIYLVGGAVDPDHEKIFWISYPLQWRIFRWLVPIPMKVANDEKLAHVNELKKMEPGWSEIKIPVTIIHGENDGLVPVENAYFAEKRLINAKVTMKIYKKTGHLIPWMNPDYMKNEILAYLNN